MRFMMFKLDMAFSVKDAIVDMTMLLRRRMSNCDYVIPEALRTSKIFQVGNKMKDVELVAARRITSHTLR
jgi:hypothetical protein